MPRFLKSSNILFTIFISLFGINVNYFFAINIYFYLQSTLLLTLPDFQSGSISDYTFRHRNVMSLTLLIPTPLYNKTAA